MAYHAEIIQICFINIFYLDILSLYIAVKCYNQNIYMQSDWGIAVFKLIDKIRKKYDLTY